MSYSIKSYISPLKVGMFIPMKCDISLKATFSSYNWFYSVWFLSIIPNERWVLYTIAYDSWSLEATVLCSLLLAVPNGYLFLHVFTMDFQVIHKVRSCSEDNGIHWLTIPSAGILHSVYASVSHHFQVLAILCEANVEINDAVVETYTDPVLFTFTLSIWDCRFVRDFVYDNVASNRYTIFGHSDSCEL